MDTIPWMISMSSPSPPASGTEKHHELGWDGEMGKWVGLMLVNVTNAPKKNPMETWDLVSKMVSSQILDGVSWVYRSDEQNGRVFKWQSWQSCSPSKVINGDQR